jgi:hypothetical protein
LEAPHEGGVTTHCPAKQISPAVVQSWQGPPVAPHASSAEPPEQAVPLQQPDEQVEGSQAPPPAPAATLDVAAPPAPPTLPAPPLPCAPVPELPALCEPVLETPAPPPGPLDALERGIRPPVAHAPITTPTKTRTAARDERPMRRS